MVKIAEMYSGSPSSDGDGYCEYYNEVGTLGDDVEHSHLTCSFHAVERWGHAKIIRPFLTFEAAASTLRTGELDAMVVPGAYPNIGSFIFDSGLQVSDVFISQIPPMVLAGAENLPPPIVESIFLHPATRPLLKEVPFKFSQGIPATSNVEVCQLLKAADKPSLAITNRLCADFFRLAIHRVLRAGVWMPFVVFTRSV